MANIQSYLDNISSAENGESVRDSIVKALKTINEDNPTTIKPLNVTQNGTYTGEQGMAYSPVTVNVEGGGQSAVSFDTIKITENGYYEPAEGHAYSGVEVDVPQAAGSLGEKIITADGVYNASDDGLSGWSKVTVRIGGDPGAKHVVRFHAEDGTLLQTVSNVEDGGGAVYTGPTPTSSGMYFIGWNPNPTNVRTDLDCYPTFSDASGQSDITDTWLQIARNVQNDKNYYALGSRKFMELRPYTDPSGVSHNLGSIVMRLVAIGADELSGGAGYANTTWVANHITTEHPPMYVYTPETAASQINWDTSWLRLYLNTEFKTEAFPTELIPYLKTVVKYSKSRTANGDIVPNAPSLNEIWIPSYRELFGGQAAESNGPYYDFAFPDTDSRRRVTYSGVENSYWTRSYSRRVESPPGDDYHFVGIDGNIYGADSYVTYNALLIGFCL